MTECTIPTTCDASTQTQNTAQETTHEPERYIAPAVDIYETAEGLTVIADLPGLTQDHINVSVEKDILTIKGVVTPKAERAYSYREFEPVSFLRQFRLGSKIDQTAIKAEYQLGVLRLRLPFAAESKPRVVQVKVA